MDKVTATQGNYPDAYSASVSTARTQSTPPVPGTKVSDSTPSSSGVDTVTLSSKGVQTSKYVEAAKAILPPLNPETIAKLKSAIAEGSYPPPALIEGLINLVGAGMNEPASSPSA